jgi:endonuclease-3
MSLAIEEILDGLRASWPDATYELDWSTPEEMLVATILAAQATDERINKVTPGLFARYPSPEAFAAADLAELEVDLKPTGFFRRKAQTVKAVCQSLVDNFGGRVPQDMDDMLTLPGVARKTANVVLNCCFDLPSGVIVDTHVQRVSQRMGLSTNDNADRIERDLMGLVPESEWTFFGPAMVLHGRYTCKSKRPECERCPFDKGCPKLGV